jgi:hypothetical protein
VIEIGKHAVPFANDRPDRDVQRQVGALTTGALAGGSGPPILGAKRPALPESRQCGVVRIRDHEDVSASAAVASVRSSIGDVLLAPEADSATPA